MLNILTGNCARETRLALKRAAINAEEAERHEREFRLKQQLQRLGIFGVRNR